MKIYTKKGDAGETSLLGGTRVQKDNLRIEAYGSLDELNSFVGLLRDQPACQPYQAELLQVQERLFTLGSSLAVDSAGSKAFHPDLQAKDIAQLELQMDSWAAQLPELKHFVLPGGHPANSLAHVCRTVCRRAERHMVRLGHQDALEPILLQYINRLSDWFFMLARTLSHQAGAPEVRWQPRTPSPND